MNEKKNFLSTEEAAEQLSLSKPTVIKYIKEGKLAAHRVGKPFRIDPRSLERFKRTMLLGGEEASVKHWPADYDPVPVTGDKRRRIARKRPLLKMSEPKSSKDPFYYLEFTFQEGRYGILYQVRERSIVIGRDKDATFSIHDPFVSRMHARLEYSGGKVSLFDQGSTNGTIILGENVRLQGTDALMEMGDGDSFLVGKSTVKIMSSVNAEKYLENEIENSGGSSENARSSEESSKNR